MPLNEPWSHWLSVKDGFLEEANGLPLTAPPPSRILKRMRTNIISHCANHPEGVGIIITPWSNQRMQVKREGLPWVEVHSSQKGNPTLLIPGLKIFVKP